MLLSSICISETITAAGVETGANTQIKSFNVPAELYTNSTYLVKGDASSSNRVLYAFYIIDHSEGVWKLAQDYSDSNTFNWTPQKAGNYRIEMHVKDVSSNKTFEVNAYKDVTVYGSNIARDATISIDSQYNIIASGVSSNKVLYEFWVVNHSDGIWKLLKPYGETSSYLWKPEKAGYYRIEVHIKDINSRRSFDSFAFKDITVKELEAKINNFSVESILYTNKESKIVGSATSHNEVLYEFYVVDHKVGTWQLLQAYSENPILNWTPSKAGQYRVEMHVKDKSSRRAFDDNAYKDITVCDSVAKLEDFSIGTVFYTNKTSTITANAASTSKPLYEYWVVDHSVGIWQLVQAYSESSFLDWTPSKAGNYRIEVHVKDTQSKKGYDDYAYKDIVVYESAAKLNQFSVPSEYYTYRTLPISGNASSPIKVLYEYWVNDHSTGTWQLMQPYSENPDFRWVPTKPGKYRVELHVKDINSKRNFDDNAYKDIDIYEADTARSATISIDSQYNITASGLSENKVLYEFWVVNHAVGTWQLLQPFSENRDYSWKPDRPGRYRIEVHIKDVNSNNYFDANAFKDLEIKPEGLIGNKYLLYSYYDKSLGEFIDIQMERQPALSMYNSVKRQYEWRYAQIRNGQKGYFTYDANNVQVWIESPVVYEQIKQQLVDNASPSNIISDDRRIYQFLKLSYTDGVKASDLNSVFSSDGVLKGWGQVFIDAAKANNINPIYLAAHAILETGNGKSQLAKGVSVNGTVVYNLFGIHAYDSDPIGEASKYAAQRGWTSIEKAIYGGASWISSSYINHPTYKQDTLYKMRWNPANPGVHQYATDIRWAYNQIDRIKSYFDMFPNAVLVFDFPWFEE